MQEYEKEQILIRISELEEANKKKDDSIKRLTREIDRMKEDITMLRNRTYSDQWRR